MFSSFSAYTCVAQSNQTARKATVSGMGMKGKAEHHPAQLCCRRGPKKDMVVGELRRLYCVVNVTATTTAPMRAQRLQTCHTAQRMRTGAAKRHHKHSQCALSPAHACADSMTKRSVRTPRNLRNPALLTFCDAVNTTTSNFSATHSRNSCTNSRTACGTRTRRSAGAWARTHVQG